MADNNEFHSIIHDSALEKIDRLYRQDEEVFAKQLIELAHIAPSDMANVQIRATQLVSELRQHRTETGGLDAFMFQYDLSSEEGIALMCMAEALLRIPDKDNVDKLIRDKLTNANWSAHMGKSHSLFVNAATWALMLTGKIIHAPQTSYSEHSKGLTSALKKLASKGGEPIVRQAISHAMKILGKQFVMGRNMKEALKRARKREAKGYRYSYDMLGEAAYTKADAEKYYQAYVKAIEDIGKANKSNNVFKSAGISIKLSALHPRYEMAKLTRIENELYERVKALALLAKQYEIGLTIDAEESYRLIPSLIILKKLLNDKVAAGWDGLGLAVQAYQKRALGVIEYLNELCTTHDQTLCVRLVKGAYWDTEIKLAQVQGMSDYPVFTRKVGTDVNYIACAKKLCEYKDRFYLQFATHNAMTLSMVEHFCRQYNVTNFEYQCLHGMGDLLYDQIIDQYPCRIYAPVGSHEDLLPYLVRRLLENGANTSFVNRIANDKLPLDKLVKNPCEKLIKLKSKRHSHIPLPKHLYGQSRINSSGLDLSHPKDFIPVLDYINKQYDQKWEAKPTCCQQVTNNRYNQASPINRDHILGCVYEADDNIVRETLKRASRAYTKWRWQTPQARHQLLNKAADLLEETRQDFYTLLMFEGGKILEDAVNEVREAIDFCRYYANQALQHQQTRIMPGPTGELNQFNMHGRGIIACISPWNFPLAIFLGQVTAALASGNCVIAKPAAQTALIGAKAIALLHQAGFDKEVVQLLPGSGQLIGSTLLTDERVNGVLFTGSTETAKIINQTLAARQGPIVPFIAETGGQNAMIVDSSALPEQVVRDVIVSAFKSAGQRCSALRVLFLQEEVADKIIAMLQGATEELVVGDPLIFSTDVGPVIDKAAQEGLQQHADKMAQVGKRLCAAPLSAIRDQGCFFAPQAFEIESINILENEVFGPILHVVRFKGAELDSVIDAINGTGFGLTLGIHSRIDETVDYIVERAKVGNIYVNRNMIGAVVGVQPFGGEGLSGTGPKAGGPNYLIRLSTERTVSTDTTASGGNATLMTLCDDSNNAND